MSALTARIRMAAPPLRRYLAELALSGVRPVWAEFVDEAWRNLSRGRASQLDTLGTWRQVRDELFDALDALELDATVYRTDAWVPLLQHHGGQAGLVGLHRPGADPATPRPPAAGTHAGRHARRMAERFGLHPHDGLPTSLLEFCGQDPHGQGRELWTDEDGDGVLEHLTTTYDADGTRGAAWVDHAAAWLDEAGDLVLTVEPYDGAFDPHDVVRDLDGLPLQVEVVRPGVWHDETVLLVLRHDPHATVLPAAHAAADVVEALPPAMSAQESAARAHLAATLPPPTPHRLQGLVARVLAGSASEQLGLVMWAAGKLYGHVYAGQLLEAEAVRIVEGVLHAVGGVGHSADAILREGQATAWRAMFRDLEGNR